MVSAVSSQAATLDPLAYAAQSDDDSAKQSASNTTPDSTDRGPATQVSLSQDALDRLIATFKQGGDAAHQAMEQFGRDQLNAAQATEVRFKSAYADMQAKFDAVQAEMQAKHKQIEIDQINYQLNRLDWQEDTNNSLASTMRTMQEDAIKWQGTTPVPEVQLSDAQIDAILKKVTPHGIDPSKIGGADTYSFGEGGKMYTFRKDGTAWVHQGGVPPSEEQKQRVYQAMNESMLYLSTRIEYPSVSRADLIAKRDALKAQ
jgi:hypothetical protein